MLFSHEDVGDLEVLSEDVRRWQLDLKLKSLEDDIVKLTTELKKEQTKPEYNYDEAYNFYVQYGFLPPDFQHFPQCPLSGSNSSINELNTGVHHQENESAVDPTCHLHGLESNQIFAYCSGSGNLYQPEQGTLQEHCEISEWENTHLVATNRDVSRGNLLDSQSYYAPEVVTSDLLQTVNDHWHFENTRVSSLYPESMAISELMQGDLGCQKH